MAIARITSTDEVLSYLSKESETDSNILARIDMVHRLSEKAVRRYVGCNLVTATYTHVLPSAGLCINKTSLGEILRLPEYPVRSITSIREDTSAYGGAASSAWASETLLVNGTDYYLAVDQSGLSWFGHVVRRSTTWPAVPGSIRIVYTAGWSAAELDGDVSDPRLDVSDIKLATLKTVAETYNRVTQQNSGGGRIISEKLDDYFVQYAADDAESSVVQLPADAKMLMAPFKRRTAA